MHRVTELIKNVAAGRSILMAARNIAVVSGICDRVTVLQRGAVLAGKPIWVRPPAYWKVGLSRTVSHYQSKAQPENEQLQSRMMGLAGERRASAIDAFMCYCDARASRLFTCGYFAFSRMRVGSKTAAQAAWRGSRKRTGGTAKRAHEVWSMDVVSDALANGRRIMVLTIVDDFTKESVDLVAEHRISGHYIVRVLERAAQFRAFPWAIQTDQGP